MISLLATNVLLAQSQQQPLGGVFSGLGFIGDTSRFANQENPINRFSDIMSILVGFLTVIAGLWFTFQFFIGAFGWLTAGSDKAALENAQKRLTNSLIGLVIVVSAIFLISIVGKVLNLDILNPGDFLLNIWSNS